MASHPRDALQQPAPAGGPRHTLTRPAQLAQAGLIDAAETDRLDRVAQQFSVALAPAMAALIDRTDDNDPIARQFVPSLAELLTDPQDVSDPIGDARHTPVRGIVHRYPDRLLLLPLRVCPVYCRFCFRRETVGSNEPEVLGEQELGAALDYIRAHKEVWEVILSGGDPLILSPRRLRSIVNALDAIEHVKVIRIHSRVPVVDPARISAALLDSLTASKPVYIVLHTNHPRELSTTALDACRKLSDAGIALLSQSVLLKGVNDDAAVLEELFRTLVANRIKPYYLHHADRAPGTAHFRTSVARGQQLMRELRGRVSGLCLPEYVLDIPGGHGKSPLAEGWVRETEDGLTVTDYNGNLHDYPEAPMAEPHPA